MKWNPENWIQFLVLWVNTYQIAHLRTLPPPRSYIYISKRNWCLGGIHLPRWRNGHVTLTRFSFGDWFKIFIKFIFNKYIFAHVSLPVEKEILIVNVQFGKYSLIKPKIVSNFLDFSVRISWIRDLTIRRLIGYYWAQGVNRFHRLPVKVWVGVLRQGQGFGPIRIPRYG